MGLLLFSVTVVRADTFAIDWFTLDGGGGTSTNGQFSVSGTIGQADAGKSSGGGYVIDGGFWSVSLVVQTEGAPQLKITRSGGNIILSWPLTVTGFHLEDSGNLATPAGWQTNAQSVVVINGENTVTVPASAGLRFFRLHQP